MQNIGIQFNTIMHYAHHHYTSFTKQWKNTRKNVVRDFPPPGHEPGLLQLEFSGAPLGHSTDNMGRPILVLFHGKVSHS